MSPGPGGSKSRLAKAAGAEPSGHMRDERLQAAVVRSSLEVASNISFSEHSWKLRCRKSARCYGMKHMPKSDKAERFKNTLGLEHGKKTSALERLWKLRH